MAAEAKVNSDFEKNKIELQAFNPSPSFRQRLREKYEKKIVTVEFKCDGFLKKATGCLNIVGCDFLELTGRYGKKVSIEIFRSFCKDTIMEKAFRVNIPIDNVCSVELKTPCKPCVE